MNIVVLHGGTSPEREVSIKTAEAIKKALETSHNLSFLDTKEAGWRDALVQRKPEFVFIALHGGEGENGTVQRFLDELRLPYNGSGAEASKLAIDKVETKVALATVGIVTPTEARDTFPCVVKPRFGGSSIRTTIVQDGMQLRSAIGKIEELKDEPLVERLITGQEVTCGILEVDGEPVVLPIYSAKFANELFDYDAKYSGKSEEKPAKLDEGTASLVAINTKKAFATIGCQGYARADIVIGDNGPVMLEISTLPGLTKQSFMPKMAASAGYTFPQLLEIIIKNGLSR